MLIEIKNVGRVLIALQTSRSLLTTRNEELARCSSCGQERKDQLARSLEEIKQLIQQIEKQS